MKYIEKDTQLFLYSYSLVIMGSIVRVSIHYLLASYELSHALEHVQFSIAVLHIAM